WFAVANSFLDVPGQEPLLLSIFRDVTDRRGAEEALREADRRKDEFLAVLSHELRSPLATIRAALEVLRIRGPDRRQATGWAREREGRRASPLVRARRCRGGPAGPVVGKIPLRREPGGLGYGGAQGVRAGRPVMKFRGQGLAGQPARGAVRLWADRTRLVQVV